MTVVPYGQTLLGQVQLLERRGEGTEAPLRWTLISGVVLSLYFSHSPGSNHPLPGEWELKVVSQEAVRTDRHSWDGLGAQARLKKKSLVVM